MLIELHFGKEEEETSLSLAKGQQLALVWARHDAKLKRTLIRGYLSSHGVAVNVRPTSLSRTLPLILEMKCMQSYETC